MVETNLILPGHPLFDLTLQTTLPPGWQQLAQTNFAFVVRSDSGMLDLVDESTLEEYVEGGEYEERLTIIGDNGDNYG